MNGIASIGAMYVDINAPAFPIPSDANQLVGAETVGSTYEIVLGGSAVNFVRFCKTLGMSAVFIGKAGNDRTKEVLISLFGNEGITPALSISPDAQTNMNTNLVDSAGRSIMLSFGNANQSLNQDDILQQLEKHMTEIQTLYLGGVFKLKNLLPKLSDIIGFAKSRGKQIIVDHGRLVNTVTEEEKEIMKNLVKQVDVYLPSKDEFLQLWNVDSIESGLALFKSTNITVVVKDAENGSYSIQSDALIHSSAFHVDVANTVGTGDAFNAGFIKAQTDGIALEESMRFANATAALKISTAHFPNLDQINAILSQQNH